MKKGIAILAAAALTLSASVALAHVIDPAVNKDAAKHRADIAKQVSKYTFCLVKAASKCEKKGVNSGVECHLNTGVVDYDVPASDVTTKFQDAIAKCDAKMVLNKKGNDYAAVGCPGDCNPAAPGTQACADIAAFEASVEGTVGLTVPKFQLGLLAGVIDTNCATDNPGTMPTDQVRIDCAADQAKLLSKLAQGIFKCQAKCENDFKNSKGNGGPNNDPNCQAGDPGADPAFSACISSAESKVLASLSPTVNAVARPLVVAAVNDATNGLYNRFDPTGAPDDSPCGTCGDNTREGAEECDGTDDAACPGNCNADCTCPKATHIATRVTRGSGHRPLPLVLCGSCPAFGQRPDQQAGTLHRTALHPRHAGTAGLVACISLHLNLRLGFRPADTPGDWSEGRDPACGAGHTAGQKPGRRIPTGGGPSAGLRTGGRPVGLPSSTREDLRCAMRRLDWLACSPSARCCSPPARRRRRRRSSSPSPGPSTPAGCRGPTPPTPAS